MVRDNDPGARIIVALDFPDEQRAMALVERLDPAGCRLKVGKELFTRSGPVFVKRLVGRGFDVFLDLKYHDIPNTVAAACEAAADLGVWMVNVHASGGRRMMEAAAERLAHHGQRPLLIGVTVLTSMNADDLHEVGVEASPAEQVRRLAHLARDSGLDGVVCSPLEVADLRARLGAAFLLVTPGVRPAEAAMGDQRRVMTPAQAIGTGSDYLVIGRPITAATDPVESLERIQLEITNVERGN